MNVKKIKEIIEDRIQPNSWEIRRLRKKSFQRYLIFKEQESQRVVENEKFLVTLYKNYEQEGRKVLGESTLSLSEGDDLREKLAAAWEMAGLVANPVFVLPEKGLAYQPVQTVDPEIKEHPLFYLDKIRDDLVKTPLDRVRLSSAEIFLELKEFEIMNSLGLEQAQEETEILVEFVLLAEKGAGFGGESWGWKQGRNYVPICGSGTSFKNMPVLPWNPRRRFCRTAASIRSFSPRNPWIPSSISLCFRPPGRPASRAGPDWSWISRCCRKSRENRSRCPAIPLFPDS